MWLISSIFQGLLSHNHSSWKECYIISCTKQDVLKSVQGGAAEHASSDCSVEGQRLVCCLCLSVCLSSCCSHACLPCAKAGLMHCLGNNNVSVSIMSYFIECWVAKVLEQLLGLCRMLNTQSDRLFSVWGKTCPLILNTLKLLLACLKQHMTVLLISNILSYSGFHSLPKLFCSEICVKQVCFYQTYCRNRDSLTWILL